MIRVHLRDFFTIKSITWGTNHIYFKQNFPIFPMNLVLFLVLVTVFLSPMLVITVALLFNYMWFNRNLLLLCGEPNPGPRDNIAKLFSNCHRNLNNKGEYNFARLVLLKAHNSVYKFDIIVYWKLIFIQLLYLMIAMCKF